METTFFFILLYFFCIFLGSCAMYFLYVVVFRKTACQFGQVQTKMYFPKSPFFKNSLAGASRQVLLSVPGCYHTEDRYFPCCWCVTHLFVRCDGGFDLVAQLDEFPSLEVLALLDGGQLAHQLLNITVEMLDGLHTILEVAEIEDLRFKI